MFDMAGLGAIIIFIVFIILGLLLALKLLSPGETKNPADRDQLPATPIPADESKFLHGFLRPIYGDGIDHLETGVEVVKESLDFYERNAYVDAGEGFINAGRSIDAAARKFREVLNMVEDPDMDYAKLAKARLAECKQLRNMARAMEAACDAMIAGNKDEAAALVETARGMRGLAEGWKNKP